MIIKMPIEAATNFPTVGSKSQRLINSSMPAPYKIMPALLFADLLNKSMP
jgi:hypothetical protein